MGQTSKVSRNNTTVTHGESGKFIRVRLHATEVVYAERSTDGGWEVMLNTGGWMTATTVARMNQAAREFDLGYTVSRAGKKMTVAFWSAMNVSYEFNRTIRFNAKTRRVSFNDIDAQADFDARR